MYITTTGLILRETIYKESSKILTVLTSGKGKLTVNAKGVRRKGSKNAAACQLLAFSEMTLFNGKGRYILTEARSLELFERLRDNIELISLGSYFTELLDVLCADETPEPEMMALGLNALFALSEGKYPVKLIKAAFEMRLMCIAGFAPVTECCGVCGETSIITPYISIDSGIVLCEKCMKPGLGKVMPLCDGSLNALRYIISSKPKRVFSFKLGEKALERLYNVCEEYVKIHLDRNFKTLDFYKSVKLD
jgi:DNA repair protein RecO (recombination protein O)